MDSDICS